MSAQGTPVERLWRRSVVRDTGCIEWTGALDSHGYGRIRINQGLLEGTHRVAWESVNGPIPDGLELDHLCRNKQCCNPAHLEPVTHAENMRRTAVLTEGCPSGHPWTEQNTYWSATGKRCRTCHRNRELVRHHAKKAAA